MRLLITENLANLQRGPAGSCLVIVCPWLAGLPAETGLWISALPIHDVNAMAEAEEPVAIPPEFAPFVYFGVFALDRFRAPARLFEHLRARGIAGIVNLPSVTFFDGRTAGMLKSLDFGLAQEIAFLKQAKAAGLRVGVCARASQASDIDAAPFDFILAHDGPSGSMALTWRGDAGVIGPN